jgi:hypothetical protein
VVVPHAPRSSLLVATRLDLAMSKCCLVVAERVRYFVRYGRARWRMASLGRTYRTELIIRRSPFYRDVWLSNCTGVFTGAKATKKKRRPGPVVPRRSRNESGKQTALAFESTFRETDTIFLNEGASVALILSRNLNSSEYVLTGCVALHKFFKHKQDFDPDAFWKSVRQEPACSWVSVEIV